jgi:hypothetical protein
MAASEIALADAVHEHTSTATAQTMAHRGTSDRRLGARLSGFTSPDTTLGTAVRVPAVSNYGLPPAEARTVECGDVRELPHLPRQ